MHRAALCLLLWASPLFAQSLYPWTLAKSSHFEIFSQTTDQSVANAFLWFEQIRDFFEKDGLHIAALNDVGKPPLRIVAFRSEKEYAEYRLRPLASAFFASDGNRDYIVMASLQPAQFGVAAHEYSHYVLHTSGVKFPPWLEEGLGEVFSTLRVNRNGYELGGKLPARAQTLEAHRGRLLSLSAVLAATENSITSHSRREAELFYAESWALVDLLLNSPKYGPRFQDLVLDLSSASTSAQSLEKVFGVSQEEIAKDLSAWISTTHEPTLRPGHPLSLPPPPVFELSSAHMHFLLAQLNLVSGRIDQAKSRFLDLAREQPTNPDVFASLGTIALRQNDRAEALDLWRRAIKLNVQDADLCYRYGLLADEAGLNIQEAKIGLERAIALAPNFDDARYHLALLEYRAADYRSALENLRKMAVPKDPRRLYGYWTAMASSLLELQENDEAHKVALQAAQAAQNDHDRAAALQMSYVASTELNVQFSTDADGRSRMVTTRIPRGAKDWNPFIEPSDSLQHARGKLSRVLCTNDKLTGFLLLTPNGAVTLDVADPSRVLMRNSPTEFYCGPVSDKSVAADYAVVKTPEQTRNILRGMTFDPQ